METPNTDSLFSYAEQSCFTEKSLLSPTHRNRETHQQEESNHHHRKNHRGGVKNRALRERKASAPLTSAGTTSTGTSESGWKKHGHRAGVKYRERRQRREMNQEARGTLERLDGVNIEKYESEEESNDEEENSDNNAPSLTYDSDEHEESNEEDEIVLGQSEVEVSLDPEVEIVSCEIVPKRPIKATLGNILEDTETIVRVYEETMEPEITSHRDPEPVPELKAELPIRGEVITPKPGGKHFVRLLSLLRPKVL